MKGITVTPTCTCRWTRRFTRVAIDISGRPVPGVQGGVRARQGRPLRHQLVQEWFQAFAMNAGVTLHVATLTAQRSPYVESPASKGSRARCGRRWRSIRALRTRGPRPRGRSAGDALSVRISRSQRAAELYRRDRTRRWNEPMSIYTVHQPPLGAADPLDGCGRDSHSCATASRSGRSRRRRCGCCGIGCGWCC